MDGLRAIAATTVVVNHCGLYAVAAGATGVHLVDEAARQLAAGVLLFFTLSGLLLYRPFAEAIVGLRDRPSWSTFARNRILRIVPAYWAILLFAGVVVGVAVVPHPDRMLATGSLVDHPRALLANLLLVQGYSRSTFLTGLGPAWTLAIEVGFYVTLPIVCALVLVAARRTSHRPLLTLVPPVIYLVIGVVGKHIATSALDGSSGWSRTWPSVFARSFFANADLFAAGMAVAAVAVLVESGQLRLDRHWRPCALLVALLLACAAVFVTHGEFSVFRYDQLVALAAALGVATLVVGEPSLRTQRVLNVLDGRVLGSVGLASYSLYLWHQPVIDWLRARGFFPLTGVDGLVVAVVTVYALAGLLSAITYRFIERPALRRKRQSVPQPIVIVTAGVQTAVPISHTT